AEAFHAAVAVLEAAVGLTAAQWGVSVAVGVEALGEVLGVAVAPLFGHILEDHVSLGPIVVVGEVVLVEPGDAGLVAPGGEGDVVEPVHEGLVDDGAAADGLGAEQAEAGVDGQFHAAAPEELGAGVDLGAWVGVPVVALAGFQAEDGEPCGGEFAGDVQPGGAGADDDDVVGFLRRLGRADPSGGRGWAARGGRGAGAAGACGACGPLGYSSCSLVNPTKPSVYSIFVKKF